jgi:hypothetical protein
MAVTLLSPLGRGPEDLCPRYAPFTLVGVRALLRWSAEDLAQQSLLSVATIRRVRADSVSVLCGARYPHKMADPIQRPRARWLYHSDSDPE